MYFITFSELLGTNGRKIAYEVAKKINYTFYGEEELVKAASEMGFLSDIQHLDEKGPPLLERFFTDKPKIYLDRLQSVIYELAEKGDAVFFGRGSQLLLKSFDCALHVLVTGSMEKRIERVMADYHVGKEVAERIIEKSDHDKRGFTRFAFDEDWLNPKLYDLILNTDKLNVDSAVQMVIGSSKSEEIRACGLDSVKKLGMLSLERKAEAALLEGGAMDRNIFVEVRDIDAVRLYGMVYTPEEKETVADLIKKVKGVAKVDNDIQIVRGGMGGI